MGRGCNHQSLAQRHHRPCDSEMATLCSVDLLILDDFALEPMTKEARRDVYQLFLERTGHASTIVSCNRDYRRMARHVGMACCSPKAPSTVSRTRPTIWSSRENPTGTGSSPSSSPPILRSPPQIESHVRRECKRQGYHENSAGFILPCEPLRRLSGGLPACHPRHSYRGSGGGACPVRCRAMAHSMCWRP